MIIICECFGRRCVKTPREDKRRGRPKNDHDDDIMISTLPRSTVPPPYVFFRGRRAERTNALAAVGI